MFIASVFNNYWVQFHNVTFDGNLRKIYVAPEIVTLDIESELYSSWKEWMTLNDNSKYLFAIRSVGGDPIPGGDKVGATYFMANDWKIVISHGVEFVGNLYSNDGTSPFEIETGQQLSTNKVSNLVDKIAPSAQTIEDVAQEVIDLADLPTVEEIWNADKTLMITANSIGEHITNSLTVKADLTTLLADIWSVDLTAYTTIGTSGSFLRNTGFISKAIFVDTDALANGDGTAGNPFDNIDDAKNQAETYGIREIVTYSEIVLTSNFKHFVIRGLAAPVVDTNGQDCTGSEFIHCTMRGTYVGKIVVQESVLDDGFRLNGHFERCAVAGDLVVIGDTLVERCSSAIAGIARPTISMNTTGFVSLAVRNWSGGLVISDCDHVSDVVTIEMSQGRLQLNNTNTDGVISVRGLAHFEDLSAGSVVDTTGLLDPSKSQLTTAEQIQLFEALTERRFIGLSD